MRPILVSLFALASAAQAEVPSPLRAVTDPKALTSKDNPDSKPLPLSDLDVVRSLPEAAWSADGSEIFTVNNLSGRFNIWKAPTKGGWPVQLTQSNDFQSNLQPSPDGKTLVFIQDNGGDEFHDLMAVPTAGGKVERLTNTPTIAEMNPRFSPDGTLIAFDIKPKESPNSNLAVLDVATRKVRQLTFEKSPDFLWNVVDWAPDGKSIIANRSDINYTISSVWRVNLETGAATELTPALGKDLTSATDLSSDGRSLAITTDAKTGQNHGAIFDIASGTLRTLKPTPWDQSAVRFSPDGRTLLVRTKIDGRSVMSLIDTDTLVERTLEFPAGVNDVPSLTATPFSPEGRDVLIYHSGADMPADLWVAGLDGKSRRFTRLSIASLSNLPTSEIVTFRSFDKTLISAIVTMPFNLKRDGSNPAIIVPHGGPTAQSEDFWSGQNAALASRGYIVIQPNFRGSTGYGKAFQAANVKDVGLGDLKDVLAARDFLIASGYVDPRKVGITGGSYGGYMTLMALGKAPDAFAAGVQLFGIINWFTMEQTSDPLLKQYLYGLLGRPDKDKAAYEAASPMTYIKAVKAPLLSLQGENDIRVPRVQAEEVDRILKANGKITETIFYAEEGHGFVKRENRADSLRRTIEWFDRYLKGIK